MQSVVVRLPPLRLLRCLAAPSPPVSLSRLLVTSPPRLLGSSTPASSCTGCVALLLSVCTAACAVVDAVSPAALCLARTAWSPFPVRSLGVCPGVLRIPLRYLLPPSSSSSLTKPSKKSFGAKGLNCFTFAQFRALRHVSGALCSVRRPSGFVLLEGLFDWPPSSMNHRRDKILGRLVA